MSPTVVRAPGRVNLIGDHTDYTGGLVFPMAVDRWTEIRCAPHDRVELTSADEAEPVSLPLRVDDPTAVSPAWGRYVAGVVSEMAPTQGIRGRVSTTIPIGGGMSSSHALEVAVALALGFEGSVVELAQLTQRAENRASGVPTGIMDQFAIAGGVAGHALLMDCGALTITPVPVPDDVDCASTSPDGSAGSVWRVVPSTVRGSSPAPHDRATHAASAATPQRSSVANAWVVWGRVRVWSTWRVSHALCAPGRGRPRVHG